MSFPTLQRSARRTATTAVAGLFLTGVLAVGFGAGSAQAADGTDDPTQSADLTVTIPTASPTLTHTPPPSTTPPTDPPTDDNDHGDDNNNGGGGGNNSGGGGGNNSSGGSGSGGGGPVETPATEPPLPTRPGTGDKAVIDKGIYLPGETITVSAGGFTPGEQVQLVLFGDDGKAQLVGNFTADADGGISASFALPDKLLAGTHTVQYTGWQSKRIAVADFLLGSSTVSATASPLADVPPFVWWIAGGAGAVAIAFVAVWFAVRSLREGTRGLAGA